MYQKKFTLTDLFNNDELKGVLPQVHTRITKKKSGVTFDDGTEIYYRTTRHKFDDAIDMVLQSAKNGAKNSMTRVKVYRGTNYITDRKTEHGIQSTGKLQAEVYGKIRKGMTLHNAYNDVLNAIKQNSYMLSIMGANNGRLIRETMERIANKGYEYQPKLYLTINSLEQIKAMDRPEKAKFLRSVIENIYFNDEFEKYRLPDMEKGNFITNARNVIRGYDSLKREFDRKVGVR